MVAGLPSTGLANSCENLGGGVGEGDADSDSLVSGLLPPEHAESKTSMHAISTVSDVRGFLVFLVAIIAVPPYIRLTLLGVSYCLLNIVANLLWLCGMMTGTLISGDNP